MTQTREVRNNREHNTWMNIELLVDMSLPDLLSDTLDILLQRLQVQAKI